MEKTPKSKIVGFRYEKKIREKKLNWLDTSPTSSRISQKDVIDLETLPISPDILKTTPVRLKSNSSKSRSYSNDRDSPQFKVGWNDGSLRRDFEMNSPISIAPIQRRIRRCPDILMSKLSSRKTSLENNCDILQCIDWANNLNEAYDTEKVDSQNNSDFTDKFEHNKDILDDSVDELMVLCSQAVEENIPSLTPVRSKSFDILHEHYQNVDKNEIDAKRMKPTLMSSNRSKTEEDFRYTAPQLIKDHVLGGKNSFTLINQEFDRFAGKNQKDLGSAMAINMGSSHSDRINVNNNCNKTSYNGVPNKCTTTRVSENILKPTSCSKSDSNIINTSVISSRISDLSVSNQDPIMSQLHEDDDIFCSLDFSFVDTLQKNNHCKTFRKPISVTTTRVSQPVAKYTKEQIEKRRLEAKKRLLFSKRKLTI